MLNNYIKTAFRNLIHQKWISLLNIIGLSIGITSVTLIFLYVHHELTYDAFYDDADRIFRIAHSSLSQGAETGFAATNVQIGEELQQGYEEVEVAGRFGWQREVAIKYKDNILMTKPFLAEPEILQIFSIPFVSGDPETVLVRPYTAIISEKFAASLFRETNPIGESVKIDTNYYEITGVFTDLPGNTHLQFDMLLSWQTWQERELDEHMRTGWYVPTYIKLKPGYDVETFETRLNEVTDRLLKKEDDLTRQGEIHFLQPLKRIHFHSNYIWEFSPPGNPLYPHIFIAIGLLILLIACMNFMNLSTARFVNRSVEVGIRKTLGASRKNLIKQFLGESILIAFIAHIIGMFLLEFTLPLFNRITEIQFSIHYMNLTFIIYLISLIAIIGILAGIYPALFLSSFKPVHVLKGWIGERVASLNIRKILVIGQFVISITLIIGSLMVYRQLLYMKNQPLGFSVREKFVIQFPREGVTRANCARIKSDYLEIPNVSDAAFSSSIPGRWKYLWQQWPTGEREENTKLLNCMGVDHDYLGLYDIEIIAGRGFDKSLSDSSNDGWILNRAAIRAFGWETPEEAMTHTMNDRNEPILGIVKDYHYLGLQSSIEPLGIFLFQDDYRYITLSLNTAGLSQTLARIEDTFRKQFPSELYDHFFLDMDFDTQYHREDKLTRLIFLFTLLGIAIASIGLFGMASFIAEKRRKEIGVRKVNGALVSNIVILLSYDLAKWVLIALIIACPVAWYGTTKWLETFAYQVNKSPWVFLTSGILALFIALLTISYQSFKVARENPVDSLRYE